MNFGEALQAMRSGRRVARTGWNGSGMFAWLVPAGEYPARMEAIKGFFPNDMVPYRAYYALKTAQGDVAAWTPSTSDTMADDWVIEIGGHHQHGDELSGGNQPSHIQRMELEFGSLDGNIERLEAFITTRTFAGLEDAEQQRMKRQLVAMREYRDVLKERIDAANQ